MLMEKISKHQIFDGKNIDFKNFQNINVDGNVEWSKIQCIGYS